LCLSAFLGGFEIASRQLIRVVMCAAVLFGAESIQAQRPAFSYDDLRAGYWMNFEEFKTLYVSWRLVAFPHQNAVRRHEETLKSETPQQRAAMQKGLGHREEQNEFWSDRVAFQVRTPTRRTEDRDAPGRKVAFPNHAARKDNLMSDFSEIAVYNYNGNLSDGIKFWNGVLQGSPQAAILSHVSDGDPGRFLPPLAVPQPLAQFVQHPFDAFFSGDYDDARVVDRVELDGHETYVVEKVVTLQNGRQRFKVLVELAGEDINKLSLQKVQRAWIDVQRGCLPLRIETIERLIYDGKAYDDVYRLGPSPVTETQQIEKIDNGGFYPTRIKEVVYGYDTRELSGFTLSFKEIIGAGLQKKTVVPDSEQQLVAQRVEAGRDMTGLFGFDFPEGTVYFDFRTSKVVGRNYDAPKSGGGGPARARRGAAEERTLRLALIGANVLLIAVLGGIVAVRRYRGLRR
jgi:hypothetical protein